MEWLFVRAAPVMLLAALVALILLRKRKSDCQKTSLKTCVTEQRGVCAGGKKPTARSIKQDFETFFESFKIRTAWRKDFFDTLGVDRRSTRPRSGLVGAAA
ncbi:MAG TPA: hypothetical protein IAA70_02430 [Candidatus Avoscillospira stercoripullorum]|uniref:Uncharacterized protein n=1 Tax=Candidatus Avoscillospira stercoripullorum TaxID=2840709 RepID=A0A9D1A6K5_9FIRM|nr:hypothetical protein [Candidatus Avoscillospira stercoripullorum]